MNPTQSQGRNGNVKEKGKYMTWTIEMDRVLTDMLLEQFRRGNKTALGWKSIVFKIAINAIKHKCGVSVTKDNIRARLKTWEKHYKTITELLNNGFRWDDTRKMIVAEDDIWNNYVKSHPTVNPYRWKIILNYNELAIIIGNNKANGEGARNGNELDQEVAVNEEGDNIDLIADNDNLEDIGEKGEVDGDEVNAANKIGSHQGRARSCASSATKQPARKKSRSRDALASALITMVDALKSMADSYAYRHIPTVDVEKLCKEIAKIPDLDQSLILRAIDILAADKLKEHVFFGLPEELKKPWLLMQLGQSSD